LRLDPQCKWTQGALAQRLGVIEQKGFKVLRNAGRASLLGVPALPMEFDLSNDIIFKGVKVCGITGRKMFTTWYQVSQLLKS